MASPYIYANNVAAQLDANIGPSDTALLVTAGQGLRFPIIGVGEYFYATLIHISTGAIEVVKVTSRSIDTLTIVRGQDNTTPISFTTGSVVEMRVSAVTLREIDWRNSANIANGVVQLDGANLIPDARIPSTITRDTELTAGLAGKQNSLGFTPVQQGTGIGQGSNVIKIGYKGLNKIGITIDVTDFGDLATESFVTGTISAQRGAANGIAPLNASSQVPAANIAPLPYLPSAGGTISGSLNVTGGVAVTGGLQATGVTSSGGQFVSNGTSVIVATTGSGTVFLRPQGAGSTTGQMSLASTGIATCVNFVGTSDYNKKKDIHTLAPRAHLADLLEWKAFTWKDNDRKDIGLIAQQVRQHAPEHVHADAEGVLGIDKASLALELVLGLASRTRYLEAITHA